MTQPFSERIVQRLMALTPLQLRRRLPSATLEPLQLVLAVYAARKEKTVVVQVGACDGVTNDPIHQYLKKGQSQATLIEPNPYSFIRLQQAYAGLPNLNLLQVAIGHQDGDTYLYRLKSTNKAESEQHLTLQFASFYPSNFTRVGQKREDIERIAVPCRTLPSLVTELKLTKIDILQIDAEGFDAEVVRMSMTLPTLPDCIHFEHKLLKRADRQPIFDALASRGYLLGYDTLNLLAVQSSLMERMKG